MVEEVDDPNGPSLDHRNLPDLPPAPSVGGVIPAYGFEKGGKYYLYKYTFVMKGEAAEEIEDYSSYDLREALRNGASEDCQRMMQWVPNGSGYDLLIHCDRASVRYTEIRSFKREVVQIDPNNARMVR